MTTKTETPQGPGDEAVTETSPRPTREEAVKAAGKTWDEEQARLAKEQWKGMRPWPKVMQRQDKVLLWMLIGIPAFFMLTMPLRPFFIADYPIPLAFVTGSHAAVGAAAAFVGIGEGTVWLVIVAGVFGKVKITWLFWWVGRRWGRDIVNFLVPSERGRRFASRLETMNPWVMRLFLPLSYLPGVPGGIPHIIAGVSGMRLRTFMLLDVLGALMITSVVAAIGYHSGQTGVDVVLLIDSYAVWLMLALIIAMAVIPTIPAVREQKALRAQVLKEAGAAYDAETERLAAGTTAGTTPGNTSGTAPEPVTGEAPHGDPHNPAGTLPSKDA